MDRRGSKRKKDDYEYAELKLTLAGLGYYEENMQLAEMQEIIQALQLSETDFGPSKEIKYSFEDTDSMLNSTMIKNHHSSKVIESSCSSPEPHFEIITVKALVHHSMDWNPQGVDNNSNDISSGLNVNRSVRKRLMEESSSMSAKRLCLDSIENAPDSGINLSFTDSCKLSPVSEDNWIKSCLGNELFSSTRQTWEENLDQMMQLTLPSETCWNELTDDKATHSSSVSEASKENDIKYPVSKEMYSSSPPYVSDEIWYEDSLQEVLASLPK